MTAHEWFVEHRLSFVARALEPAEEDQFRRHLEGCDECRTEIARLERDLAWLPMGVDPAPPRPGLKRKLEEGVLGRGRWRWNRAASAALAAGLLLSVAGYGLGRRQAEASVQRVTAEARAASAAMAAMGDTLSIIRGAGRVLQASVTMDGHQGGMVIFADERTHRWNVVLHGLPPAGPNQRYQFWFITADGMVRGAELHPGTAQPAFLTTGMPNRGGRVMGAALTLEAGQDLSDTPRGTMLVHMML